MGKKRAHKDRGYITATEWREEGGGHKGRLQGTTGDFKRLPFHCCAITFQPFEDPVCTPDGTIMDITNAVPYITKYKRHPVTGAPLELKDLTKLNIHRNADGQYDCPVLSKVFNENTHIVAIKTTGNVYCWDAVDELCIKPKNLRDLITDERFAKTDIIHLQDPLNLTGKNLAEFDHVKFGREIEDKAERDAREADPMYGINVQAVAQDTRKILSTLGSEEAAKAFEAGGGGKKAQAERALAEAKAKVNNVNGSGGYVGQKGNGQQEQPTASDPRLRGTPRDPYANVTFKPGTHTWSTDLVPTTAKVDVNAGRPVPAPYSTAYTTGNTSTGAASKSFTSTAMPIATKNERIMVLQQLKPSKKGYIRLHTNLGDLNLELHSDLVPKTCENFLALAASGYYTHTKFHRSIKNFMIQGGDPTGTGTGGSSIFGPTFEDEIVPQLLHDGRGVLSMANSGKNTNGSQFFILYKSAPHLNFKHSVFGRVVGGFEVLTAMERIPTDEEDRPVQDVEILGVTVFVNPYTDMLDEEKEKSRKEAEMNEKKGAETGLARPSMFRDYNVGYHPSSTTVDKDGHDGSGGGGIGKYLASQMYTTRNEGLNFSGDPPIDLPLKKKKKVGDTLSHGSVLANFDAW